ncbi:MAG TPA: DNA gyrase modulator, partial [Candidatus Elarobacter sp.]
MLTALDPALLARILSRALRRGGDFADVFFESRLTQSFRLQDGRIHEASSNVVRGAGVRVVVGQRAGYAYSDDLDEASLLRAADAASLISRDGRENDVVVRLTAASAPALYDAHADEP